MLGLYKFFMAHIEKYGTKHELMKSINLQPLTNSKVLIREVHEARGRNKKRKEEIDLPSPRNGSPISVMSHT